jgi:C_GCAxxG_C_C family probable redox protein
MTDIERAVEYFVNGLSCSQAILLTYGTKHGLNQETATRLGTGFSGGFGRHGEICGAVTGAVVVIGLKYGMAKLGDDEAKSHTYRLVGEFLTKFKAKYRSIHCRDLLGCDISTEAGRNIATQENKFKTLCPDFVRAAAETLEEIL